MKALSLISLFILSVMPLFLNGFNETGLMIHENLPKTKTRTTALCTCNPTDDSLALISLYDATNGANWTNPWNLAQKMTTWQGVIMNGNGCVGKLWLDSRQLNGHIPSELGNLSELEDLILRNNQLNGNIPPELGNLVSLKIIDLSNNQISGSIPSELGDLENLEQLFLNQNLLSESIPPVLGDLGNLWWLEMHTNQLSGNIPPALGFLSNLKYLTLSENELSGSIPPELGNLLNLKQIRLNSNHLNGSIPPEFGNLGNLEAIFLNNNELIGSIPPVLGNLSLLQSLWLSSNYLSGNIPHELGNLTNLRWLYLSGNSLSGSIPSTLGNLSNLQELHLEFNELTGSIPSELGNLSFVQEFFLHINQLSGNIPPELGNMSYLKWFRLDNNKLCGSIPATLGNLNNLIWLHLSNNQLSGSIPPDLGNITSLRGLYLDINQLSCNIPAALGNLSNLLAINLYGNQLSGCLPPELLNLCPGVGDNGNISNNPNLATFSWVNFCNSNAGLCGTPQPSITLASDHPLCEGEILNLTETGGSGVFWSWEGPNGFVSDEQNPAIPNVTMLAAGNYSVTVTDGNGLTAECITTVDVHSLPTLDLGNDTTIVAPDTYLLDAGPGFAAYSWNDKSSAQTLLVTQAGEYSVTVTDFNGCQNADEIMIQVTSHTNEIPIGGRLSLYPNPASTNLNVHFERFHWDSYTVNLYDSLGQIVQSHTVNVNDPNQILKLKLDDMATGMYFLYIIAESGNTVMSKFIVVQ